jgi:hypothetical protein
MFSLLKSPWSEASRSEPGENHDRRPGRDFLRSWPPRYADILHMSADHAALDPVWSAGFEPREPIAEGRKLPAFYERHSPP